jgi:hypothetical protein
MSDDPVKRLRAEGIAELDEAADRIEKLETALQLYACGCTVRCADFKKDSRCGYTARKALDAE